jgi:hypothetical protein
VTTPWTDCYARPGTAFGVVDAAHPNGHRGQDFKLPGGGGSPQYAYEPCTVVLSGVEVTKGFTSILGYYVVAKAASDGKYLFWCHLKKSSRPPEGRVLKPGDLVGLAAAGPISLPLTHEDYPGTAWIGPHIHTGEGDTSSSVFYGVVHDPLPRIKAAIAKVTAASTTPVTPIPLPLPQEDTMIRIQHAKRGIGLIGSGYFKHLENDEEVHVSDTLLALGLITKHYNCTDERQFDVLRALAVNGEAAPVAPRP